jgi:Tfp pilus assembly protein PilX
VVRVVRLNEESGAALIIVLLTMTVFTILGMMMMGLILSNNKQIASSEEEVLKTDLAEMGYLHFYHEFNQAFNEEMMEVKAEITDQIKSDIGHPSTGGSLSYCENNLMSREQYEQLSTSKIEQRMTSFVEKGEFISQKVFHSSLSDERSFVVAVNSLECTSCDEEVSEGESLKLNFSSRGKYGNRDPKTITATINLAIAPITSVPNDPYELCSALYTGTGEDNGSEPPGDDDGGNGSESPDEGADYGITVPEPTDIESCSYEDTSFNYSNCYYEGDVPSDIDTNSIIDSQLFVNGSYATDNNLNDGIVNSTLYVTGELQFKGTIHEIQNTEIFVGGSGEFKNINNGINDSTIYITENATFDQPLNGIRNTNIYVGGNATFNNMNQGITGSLIVIGGNADFTDNINGFSSSVIYIKGSADFYQKNINQFDRETATICVEGPIFRAPKSSSGIYSKTSNPDLFEQQCPFVSGESDPEEKINEFFREFEIIWGLDGSDVEYQYD